MLIAALILSSCQSNGQSADLPRADGVTAEDIVIGADCSLPCWQGIVPGISNDDELISTLDSLEFVDAATISRAPWSGKSGYESILWFNVGSDHLNPEGGVFLDQDDIVEVLYIRPYALMTLEEFFDVVGEPEYFTVSYDVRPHTYFVWFVWLSEGVSLTFREVRGSRRSQLVDLNTPVEQISYFAPLGSMEDYLLKHSGATDLTVERSLDEHLEWQGLDRVRFTTILDNQQD